MFPATMTRDNGHIRRILIVALGALLMYATFALANTTPAHAHDVDIDTDCTGWHVVLGEPGGYKSYATNTVQIWIDGETTPSFENMDFGTTYSNSGTWDPTTDHQLRVKVLAGDLPDDPRYSFDTSWQEAACENGTTTTTTTTPEAPDIPLIDIEKSTNTYDADTPESGPALLVGSTVTWEYVVTNTGNVGLTDVKVTDDKLGAITCPQTTLIILEEMTCTATGTAELVQYANLGTVTGSYGSVTVTDTDPSHYSGIAVEGTAQLGDTVWLDVNKNGVQDNGEIGYNGADVILKDADGNVVGTLTTATGAWVGFYKFLELDAGTYTAMLDLSTIGTYQVSTANSFTVTLAEGDDYLDADFGLYEDTTPPTTTPPTTTPPTTTPPEETLPNTGINSGGLTVVAVGLLMLGALAVLATRKRRGEER